MKAGYRLLDHTADCYLSVWAGSLEDLLAQAALALQDQILYSSPSSETACLEISLQATDPQILLLNWLREILFQVSTRQWIFCHFDFRLTCGELGAYELFARCHGERQDRKRHAICKEVKAVTRHGLALTRRGRGWEAKILLDV